MGQELSVFIMMSNYFHDVATAMLLSSGVILWIITNKLENAKDDRTIDYMLKMYNNIALLGLFSIIWILVGGIIRITYYIDFEFYNAKKKGQSSALIIKHIIAIISISIGSYLWIKLSKRIKKIKIARKDFSSLS